MIGQLPHASPPDLKSWAYQHLGILGLVLVAALGSLAGLYHEEIKGALAGLASWAREKRPLPKADPQRFSVAVAHLQNDKGGDLEEFLREALLNLADGLGVQVLTFDRTIRPRGQPEDAERDGHKAARRHLAKSGAQILVWGKALSGDSARLYWTSAPAARRSERAYRPEGFELPEAHRKDLSDLLWLVIATQSVNFFEQGGNLIADQLTVFTDRIRNLLKQGGAQAWDPRSRGQIKVMFALGLSAIGRERRAHEPLEEAVATYREVLSGEFTRERAPLDWAMTQLDLGVALGSLGDPQFDPALLEESLIAFREALAEYTRERTPLPWAKAQRNVGTTLAALGEHEPGTDRLEEAVNALRLALEEFTREQTPLEWTATQYELGLALWMLGERQPGTARLEEAVNTLRVELKECTRERDPLSWAMTQDNLGIALTILGKREPGTARLKEAVTALCEAVKERARELVPLDWAMTQHHLGDALKELGEREHGTARLEEAVTAYREALKERTRERAPHKWARTHINLGNALLSLGQREPGTVRLEEAAASLRKALEVFTHERAPLDWAITQSNLGTVLLAQGQRKPGTDLLEQSAANLRSALEEATTKGAPTLWATTQNNLGVVLLFLGERKTAPALVCQALECHVSVWKITSEGLPGYASRATEYASLDMSALQKISDATSYQRCIDKYADDLRAMGLL